MDLAGLPVDEHWPVLLGVAGAAEAAGYESVWVYDHFHTVPEPSQEVTYEAWSLMAALAAATDTVRLGQMCTCNSYRPPAYLAKVAATIDVISGGRLDMGIGAGWYEHEYLGYGYEFPKASVRIGMLEEGVEIMRAMWTEDEASYQGRYYQLNGAISQPKPRQDPHIPLWIAGGGEKLTLRIAARYADYTNFGGTVDEFRRKSAVLAGHCREVGSNFDRIVRSANFDVICEDTDADVEERIRWMRDRHAEWLEPDRVDMVERTFRPMAGTPGQLIDRLRPWSDAGLGYAIVYFGEVAFSTDGLRRFASEVMPALS